MKNNVMRLLVGILVATLIGSCGGKIADAQPGTAPPQSPLVETSPAPLVPTAAPTDTPKPTEPPTLTPTPEGPQAVIAEVVNLVEAHAAPVIDWSAALVDMVLYQGGEVWAKEASTARVRLEENLVRVAPNTIFTFQEPQAGSLEINMQEGQMWLNVEGLQPGETLNVTTPSAVASVRGTRFSVRVSEEGTTVVSVMNGEVEVSAAGQSKLVRTSHMSTVQPGSPPSDPVNLSIPEQAGWGMANGESLEVALPVSSYSTTITETTRVYYPTISHDGNVFAYAKDDPNSPVRSSFTFYDIQNKKVIKEALPDQNKTWGVFFNPARPAIAYDHLRGNNVEICTIDGWIASTSSGFLADWYRTSSIFASKPAQLPAPTCFGGDGKIYGWPFWSPDGEWLLFYSNRMAAVHDFNLLNGFQIWGLSRFGSLLQQALPVLNLVKARPDGSEMTILNPSPGVFQIRQIWSPDSRQIAYVAAKTYEGPGDLWVMDADGRNPKMIFSDVQEGGFQHLAWSPDGKWLAAPAQNGGLWIVGLNGADPHQVADLGVGHYEDVTWSQNASGWPLYFLFDDGKWPRLYFLPVDGAEPEPFGYDDIRSIWSPDGSRLVFIQNPAENAPAHLRTAVISFFTVIRELWPEN